MDERKRLEEWLGEAKFARLDRFRFSEEGGRGSVVFCTAAHTYHLSFREDYLGCTASCRTVRPGESWTRGSDLPDGEFSRDTFDEIVRAVLAYELVDLDPVVEPVEVSAN